MCARLRDCVWRRLCVLPPAPRQVSPPPLQSRCAGLSRGNFRVGGGFVCTGRCLGGGDGREGYFSPLFLFIGSLTTARTAAAPPPFHVCRASRHYLPPPRGVIRCQSGLGRGGSRIKDRAAALEGAGWEAGCAPPRPRHPPWVPPQRPGSDGRGPAQPVRGVCVCHKTSWGDEVVGGGRTGAPWTGRGVQRGTGAARGLAGFGGCSLEGVAFRRSLGRVR